MEIVKEASNKLKLIWEIPIQTLKYIKDDKEYYSFRASFPIDLKNYIESNIGSLDKIDFYEIDLSSDVLDTSEVGRIPTIIGTGVIPAGAVQVASSKLVSFKKKGQLFVTLPKKVSLFKNLDVNKKYVLKYYLVYDYNVKDYILLVDVL